MDAVIVGAGITGLTIAYHLKKAGKQVLILESDDRPGGVIKSIEKNGFLLEAAANSLMAKPAVLELVDSLGIKDDLVYAKTNAKKRFLAHGAPSAPALHPVPTSPVSAIFSPVLSTRGKARLLCEPFVKRVSSDDESVSDFISRRFGTEVLTKLVSPFLSGVWAADVSQLSARSALSTIWELEKRSGSVLIGGINKRRALESQASQITKPSLASFMNGMETLPKQLAAAIGSDCLSLSSRVREISLRNDGVRVRYMRKDAAQFCESEVVCRRIYLATEAISAAQILSGLDTALAQQIMQIPYAPLGVLHLVFKSEDIGHPIDGFGFLVQPHLNFALLGAMFNSSLFPNRAPSGFHLITCFVGGRAKERAWSNVESGELRQKVVKEISQLISARKKPHILNAQTWQRAIPNYPIGHFRLNDHLQAFESAHSQIRVLGNWRNGISLSDRLEAAKQIALEQIGGQELAAECSVAA